MKQNKTLLLSLSKASDRAINAADVHCRKMIIIYQHDIVRNAIISGGVVDDVDTVTMTAELLSDGKSKNNNIYLNL